MGDRRSDSSYEGKVEDAHFAIRTNAKTLQQLSSSAEAAKVNRGKNAIASLDEAARRAKQEEDKNSKEQNERK